MWTLYFDLVNQGSPAAAAFRGAGWDQGTTL